MLPGVISGKKKWILLPPHVIPPGVFPSADGWDVTTPESVIEWFIDFYHCMHEQGIKAVECVQNPGELIFIPSQCWHAAINLEETIAVTQNFVSDQNLGNVRIS